jgi:predicted site-specific integrase-resolvase
MLAPMTSPPVEDKLISVTTAAYRLGVSERTAWRWIASGALAPRSHPVRNRTMVTEASVTALVRARAI